MEPSSQSLAIESFSHSWLLTSVNSSSSSSLDCLQASLRPSIDGFYDPNSKQLDYNMLRPRRSTAEEEESHKFCFDIPACRGTTVAPADQLFSHGVIKPCCLYNELESHTSTPPPAPPPPSSALGAANKRAVSAVNIQCQVLGRWRKLSGRVLLNYFRRLKYSWVRSSSSRKCIRAADDAAADRRILQVSPRRSSTACSPDDGWSDADSSIYEAVLHCKRSIGKYSELNTHILHQNLMKLEPISKLHVINSTIVCICSWTGKLLVN
ncbi:unnamed protein product [Linum tenue]|uniref:Membrane-associated kinase regulator 6 n=1 Tax=Linum tenue TaxID=586396 RepID=A0AAV0I7M6_9ROSI|nr:unnamed protein product [Linum tenue]